MRKNKLKELLKTQESIAYCGWLHIPNTWTAEVMANIGWDAVTIDMQHGLHNIETAIQMMQAVSTTNTVPLARVNWNEPGGIMRLLDGGAYGIICPMINTKNECEAFIGACKYPPEGYRSFGPTRARVYGGQDYGEFANDEILTIAMVETAEAVQNIDDICSVEGLDAIFIGSGDLRLSLTGKAAKSVDSEAFDEAVDAILKSCQEHGKIAGIWSPSVQEAQAMGQKGFRFIALKSDSMMLSEYAKQQFNELQKISKS